MTAANAATQLAGAIARLQQIYGQVGVTIGNITYQSTSAANTVRIQTSIDRRADLQSRRRAAGGDVERVDTPVGFDVVLLRSITNETGGNAGILGVAGGIPGVAGAWARRTRAWWCRIESLCAGQAATPTCSAPPWATSSATRSGCSTREQDGNVDPLTDTAADGQANLMYWLESSGQHLSPQQGQVIRDNPKVQ